MDPRTLARELDIDPKTLRAWLRKTHPRSDMAHGQAWVLSGVEVLDARRAFGAGVPSAPASRQPSPLRPTSSRENSDEAYVLDLCDRILGERSLRQHRFSWLRGDPNAAGNTFMLPVDAYYPKHELVVEYRERQHVEPVPHFDKPDVLTVSGVHRGEQRRLYDERREHEIPAQGLRLVVIAVADLVHDRHGRLLRDRQRDETALRTRLAAPPVERKTPGSGSQAAT